MHWLGPLPGNREARAFSWMAIVVGCLLCGFSIIRGFQGENFMGRPLGGDFVQFYVAGQILNQHEPARLYDLEFEVRLQHQAVPSTPKNQTLVFASAPYIAQICRPFALLPYTWAYVAWLIFSLVLYSAAGILMLCSTAISAQQRKTGLLLAISTMPFVLETWIGGQISVLGFFAVALFVFCRASDRRFIAGFVLALALFKPTLVAIPILMLLCGRRWRMLAGVVTGAAAVATASIATVGVKGCIAWLNTLKFYGQLATGSADALRRTKYVDIGSFLHLILGHSVTFAQVLGVLAAAVGIAILAVAWWQSSNWSASSRDLLWAATLAGALVCNVYTPIYDTILLVPAVVLAAGAILNRAAEHREVFVGWLVLLYIVPWVTQSFAEFLRFQPFTLVLAGFSCWLMGLSQRHTPHSTYLHSLGVTAYSVSSSTRNFRQWLSVLLRSYSPLATLLWERDR